MSLAVEVDGLSINTSSGKNLLPVTSLRVPQGTVTALTGPSGAGKTTLMRAVLGHLSPGTVRADGAVRIAGQDVFAMDHTELQLFRRSHVAFVSQDPGAALNPTMRVRSLLKEVAHDAAENVWLVALTRVGLSKEYLRRRPGELSGGEQRRVALARALVRKVGLLVIDEPMAGLHGELRGSIADLLRSLARDDGVTVLVSGHDTHAMRQIADDVLSLGIPSIWLAQLADRPRESLLAGPPVLRACGITATAGRRQLVKSVDITIPRAASVGLVGPSGAGKTTLARVLTGLHREASGSLEIDGRGLAIGPSSRPRRDRRRVQLIPQNPLSTLNPKRTVLQTLSRPLRLGRAIAKTDVAEHVSALLRSVALEPAMARRYPNELSGGQRQRVAIARALATDPDVLICDEITSALDDGTARSVMDLLQRTRVDRGIGLLVISHDMELVARYCQQILVLANGMVVEQGDSAKVLADPVTPQTRALLV